MELDYAVLERSRRHEMERHITMSRCDSRYAFSDEGWNDGDDELVDRSLVQERGNEVAATHHPDILAGFLPEPFDERADRFSDEFDTARDRCRQRVSRKHVMDSVAELRAHLDAEI